jgi:hypothetical protein
MRELHDNIDIKPGIVPPAAVTDNTGFVSQILDMQNLQSAEFVILTGSLADADATFTMLAEEGEQPNLSDNTAIDDRDLLGLESQASFSFVADNKVFKLGFRPSAKRYKRLTITPANNTGNAFVAGVCAQSAGVRRRAQGTRHQERSDTPTWIFYPAAKLSEGPAPDRQLRLSLPAFAQTTVPTSQTRDSPCKIPPADIRDRPSSANHSPGRVLPARWSQDLTTERRAIGAAGV